MKIVRISQFNYTLFYLPIYIAKEKGFFPFEIVFENRNNDDLPVEDVVKKRAEFSLGDPVMSAYEKYSDAITIGMIVKQLPNYLISLNPLAKEITLKDLKGKRVGCYAKNTTTHKMLAYLLKKEGLNIEKDVELVELQHHRELGPLISDEADYCIVMEPVLSQAIANGAKVVYSFMESLPAMAVSGFTCRVDQDPQLVKVFLFGVQKGIDTLKNKKEVLRIARAYFPDIEERALENAYVHLRAKVWTSTLEINEKLWKQSFMIRPELTVNKTYTNKFQKNL